ncbi:hypothetical protein PLICBS_008102 [Purpureocillium lilacinum]|uniref:uncharacterized protein n=1 Tax=Purpureocillium lilacinum TaxID=33203 RepID=UPI002083FB28|nr:hypothetical protein PLICBS_008102 [Purpureocillium lilacinum]
MAPETSLAWREGDMEKDRSTRRERLATARRSVSRRRSRSSSRNRRTIDPAAAIPIQYRSLSQDIDEAERDQQINRDKAKDAIVLKFETIDWHKRTLEDIQKRLEVDPASGISAREADTRLTKHGKNKISPLPNPWFWKVVGYFFKGFGGMLCVGGILVFISWKPLGDPPQVANLALGIVLIAVFVIQAAFNGWQDYSSSRVMHSITAMLPESCHVVRDGVQVELSATDIVPGDILLLKAGKRIPADVRFIEVSHDMSTDRAVLTGMMTFYFNGTKKKEILRFVLLIFAIMVTWIVVLAAVWGGWLRKEHPGWISVPALIVSCVSVAIAYIPEGLPIAVTASLTITANLMKKNKILCKSLKTVETLGAVSVVCSDKTGTLTSNRMSVADCALNTTTFTPESAKDEVALKRNSGLEQLRAVAGLCNAASFDAETLSRPLAERRIFGDATDQASLRFAEGLGPVSDLNKAWKSIFELAFDSKNKFMAKAFTLSTSNGLGISLSSSEATNFKSTSTLLTAKGAPDVLLERCSHIVSADGQVVPMTEKMNADIKQLKDKWSSEGKRVILLARKVLNADIIMPSASWEKEELMLGELKADLTLVGLLALIDPPRPEIPDVMQTLRGAGIRTFMVTGDFGLTALAIARQCAMVTSATIHDSSALARFPTKSTDEKQSQNSPDAALVLTGSDLMKLNGHQWEQVCSYPEIVFSRTTPDQKLRIVREFQARDQVVGMTGDGVNDAPALKAADIGISLASGSDIAIEAADMVLLDSFAAIVEAVRYGRLVFDNLKKIIAYLLPAGSWSEFWPVFTNVIFGLPQILSSFLMIIICCFTDCIGAVVLAYEKPEADLLLRAPRNLKTTKLVNWQLMFHAYALVGMIESLLSFTMAYWYLERTGIHFGDLWFKFGEIPASVDPDYYYARLNEASSIYFINLVVMQWFNLMAVRTRHLSIFQHPPAFNKATQNLLLFPAIVLTLGIAVIWLYVPKLQEVLGTSGVPAEHYFLPGALGLGLLCLDEGRKACVRRWPNGILAKMAW